MVKVNFDGAMKAGEGSATGGVIIRDERGDSLLESAFKIDYVSDSFQAEARACYKAVALATNMGFRNMIFEGDSLAIIRKMNSHHLDLSPIGTIMEEAKRLLMGCLGVKFLQVHRKGNQLAHALAMARTGTETDMMRFRDLPEEFTKFLEDDEANIVNDVGLVLKKQECSKWNTLTHRNKQGTSTLLTRFLNSPSSLLTHPYYSTSKGSLQTLAYEEILANPNKPYTHTALILHRLLGSARHWRSFSRSLASSLSNSLSSEWRMVLVDLRNHGKSVEIEGLDSPHDMVNAAKDLGNLINFKAWGSPDVVIGHSMGGKVALQFAQSCGNRDYGENVKLPKQLWVLDSVPREVTSENSDGEVEKVLQTLQSLPSTVPSRKWLVNHMLVLGFSKSLSEWIGTNLKKSGGEETWAFNLEGAVQIFRSYRDMSYWSLLEHPPKGLEIAIARAEKSDRWDADVVTRLKTLAGQEGHGSAEKISVHVLPNSSHWVNVDNP